MNCYLVEIRFLRPFESFGKIVAEHRTYLQQAYDQGLLLLSGPRQDGKGGLCIARASSEAVLREFLRTTRTGAKGWPSTISCHSSPQNTKRFWKAGWPKSHAPFESFYQPCAFSPAGPVY